MSFPIKSMNHVLDAWKGEYDLFSKVSMQFQEDSQNRLCFNGNILETPHPLDLKSAAYTSERINYYFRGHQRLTILISWPENQAPKIKDVFFAGFNESFM